MSRKKRKIVIAFISIFLFVGCSDNNKKVSVIWYVENGTFDILSDDKLYKPVENSKTKALTELLQKNDFPYDIIFKCYGDDVTSVSTNFIESLKKKDSNLDIVTFEPLEYSEFVTLDEELLKEEFNELKDILPSNAWRAHELNGHLYQIPKPMVYYLQPSYSISDSFVAEKNISMDTFNQEYTEVMTQLTNIVENDSKLNKEYNFTSSEVISLEELNSNDYKSITSMSDYFFEGIVIRKSDHKVKNIYEEDYLKQQFTINQQNYSKNLDGHKEQLDIPFLFGLSYAFPSEYKITVEGRTIVPIKEAYAGTSIGYGIVNNSKHKREALQAMQFIYTSKEASNLFIYGIEGKDYIVKDGRAIMTEENSDMLPYGTFAKLGNNLIAYPSAVEPLNKKEIADIYNEKLPNDRINQFVPDFKKIEGKYKQVTEIYVEAIRKINYSENIDDINAYYKQLNEKLYSAGLQDVIDELQKQVDSYMGGLDETGN